MKLQLALDEFGLEEALVFAKQVAEYVDIIEIGTPFVIDEGMRAVRAFKEAFPEKEILADEKIMDGGFYEADMAFHSGAEYATVLGVTDNRTIQGCVDAAKKNKKQSVVDMICVKNYEERIREVEELGVDVIAVHVGADQQAVGRTPLEDLKLMKQTVCNAKVAVAGGINSKTIKEYVALKPDIVIVGSGITHATDPVAEAKAIKEEMEKAV